MGVSISVERLRRWLLAGAGLLVAVIVAFLGYAHYRAHRFLAGLPAKLGADIRQETNGFTYSQSDGKRTIYTIHASKAVEHKDGRYTLHDVGIVLYGRKSDRADRIYGSEFEYDQKEGVVRAMGEVHLDLQAPEAQSANAKMDYAAGKDLADRHEVDSAHLIHVTTSGLVYLQKLGVAATDEAIEFEAGGMKGQAVGADYTSDTGVLVLHSAVRLAGVERGRPAVLTAARAELDRENQRVTLDGAKYVSYVSEGKAGGGSQTAEAARAVAHLRSDGTVERVDADGSVTLRDGAGGMVTAPRGVVTINAQNQPQSAVLSGGVIYGVDEPLRKAGGSADEGRLAFDRAGRLEQVVMSGAVHLDERVRSSAAAGAPWGERQLSAGEVELALSADGSGKTQLRDAKASGGATLVMVRPVVKAAGKKGGAASGAANGRVTSSLGGDVLTAHFVQVGGVDHLAEVRGEGHTSLRRVSAAGAVETSSADSLVAVFRPARVESKKSAAQTGLGADEIATAVEQGHVVMTQQPVRKAGETSAPAEERARAERASYDGALETTTLTGNVQVSDADSVLWANRVVANQKTGDAVADGAVKVSYLEPKSAKSGASAAGAAGTGTAGSGAAGEPVHVLAARAELKRNSGVATFWGAAGQRTRLWQGASQVEAPVIQFDRKQKRLVAKGEGEAMAVRTVLTSAARPAGKAKAGGAPTQSVLQVMSRELTYSDQKREADFTGGVQVTSADGRMQASQAVVYLQAAGAKGQDSKSKDAKSQSAPKLGVGAVSGGFMGGSVERMVAGGGIVIEQPGRRATGEQVVYTAGDGTFALTGTPGEPPKVVDDERGTVTGTLLEFRAGDESVVVSNGRDSGAGERVRTETRVKKQR